MSSASVTSSKRESVLELKQEIEAIQALNSSLRVYLESLQSWRKDMRAVNDNCLQLTKVNHELIDIITTSNMK